MITIMLVGALVATCLGALIGSSLTTQALEGRLRHQARERRTLNEEWNALRAQRLQQHRCHRCDEELGWRREPALVVGTQDDDED